MNKKPVQFEIVDEYLTNKQPPPKKQTKEQSSFERLLVNSKHIEKLLTVQPELKKLRFNELDLLRDIQKIVEDDPLKFDTIKDPVQYRREIRSKVLPQYLTYDFLRLTREKLLSKLLAVSNRSSEQDALTTALVFLQSHTDLGLACEDNPLWEIIFNLSIKDGIRFVDSLTALIEGLDSIRNQQPDILTQEPNLLKYSKQICQWPIFWRQLVEYNKDVEPYESLISALLRGEMMIELYFDEIIHLPLLIYKQFKNDSRISNSHIADFEKEEIAKTLFQNIIASATIDLPSIIPTLKKRINKAHKKIIKQKNKQRSEQFDILIKSLDNSKNSLNSNIFLLTLLVAKISIKTYWENKRDFFFFFTILKDPENVQNYFDFTQILYKLKYVDSIENVLNCAIEINEHDFWGYWGLGKFYLKQNRLNEAEHNLYTALRIAQHAEIQSMGKLERELFLIKEDIKSLKQKKVKQITKSQPQIDLF